MTTWADASTAGPTHADAYASERVRGFSDATRRDVRAFAEAFFSRDYDPPPRERMDWFLDDLDDFVSRLNPRSRGLFHLVMAVPTYVAPLCVKHLGRLEDLPVRSRVAALDALERSPLGLPLFAAKAMVSLVYYEHPDAAREIGWDQRCMGARR
jgi:hypothetical protein